MMYENLIKRLRNCASDTVEDCAGCPYIGGYNGTYCMNGLITEAADAIEVLSKKEKTTQWIPVTERLPDDRRDVQITVFWHDAWRTMYGYYDGAFWHLYAPMHTEVADVEVIGWMEKPAPMPLPEPPKEEQI